MAKILNKVMDLLERTFRAALNVRSPKMVQRLVLSIIKRWEDARGDRYGLAVYMQPYLSERFGHPLCDYCQFVVWPEEGAHDHCQKMLEEAHQYALEEEAEITAAWAVEKTERDEVVAREEAAAWAEYRREPEMVYH